jgi:restriction endonuclease S subunit
MKNQEEIKRLMLTLKVRLERIETMAVPVPALRELNEMRQELEQLKKLIVEPQ